MLSRSTSRPLPTDHPVDFGHLFDADSDDPPDRDLAKRALGEGCAAVEGEGKCDGPNKAPSSHREAAWIHLGAELGVRLAGDNATEW